jgi:hypothetical protein
MIDHRPGHIHIVPILEGTFEDIPDLGKVVIMARVPSSRFVSYDASVGLRWPIRIGVKQHLAGLAREALNHPFLIIEVPALGKRMCFRNVCHGQAPDIF